MVGITEEAGVDSAESVKRLAVVTLLPPEFEECAAAPEGRLGAVVRDGESTSAAVAWNWAKRVDDLTGTFAVGVCSAWKARRASKRGCVRRRSHPDPPRGDEPVVLAVTRENGQTHNTAAWVTCLVAPLLPGRCGPLSRRKNAAL